MLKNRIALAMAVGLGACSAPAGPKISAQDGWARATGPSDTASAYVTIANKGGADQLTGVHSTIGDAMLHESAIDGGVVRMRPIDPGQGLSVPSNGKLVLAPGGAHVMITGLKQPLKAGDRFGLTLQFAKAGPEKVEIAVKPAGEQAHGH
jgi:periplasmic copper chaperone A